MDKTTSTTVIVIVIIVAFVGMILGWRSRRKRQSALPDPESVPENTGRELLKAEGFYVATTIADEELNRVVVAGLGYRSRASVSVTESGIVLALAAVPTVFIPLASIRGIDRATYTIDRVVEKGGLVRIRWTLGETDVDSYLRLTDTAGSGPFIDTVLDLLPAPTLLEGDDK